MNLKGYTGETIEIKIMYGISQDPANLAYKTVQIKEKRSPECENTEYRLDH